MTSFLRAVLAIAISTWVVGSAAWAVESVPHPLTRPDTSSPHATLTSFLENARTAYTLAAKARASLLSSDRSWTNDEEIALARAAWAHINRAADCLDLSKIPGALLSRQAPGTAILLKEVLDRIDLPPPEEWPGAEAGVNEASQIWRVANTDISIYRVSEGPRAGEYLFSPETVKGLEKYYQQVRHLPYQDTTTKDWYERYITNPKGLSILSYIPVRSMIDPPEWMKTRLFGQGLLQWFGLAIALLLGAAIVVAIHVAGRFWLRRHPDSKLSGLLIRVVELLAVLAILSGLDFVANEVFGITVWFHQSLFILFWAIEVIVLAWLAWVASAAVAETIIVAQHLTTRGVDSQLIRLAFRLLAVVLVSAILIEGANRLGLPSYSILTGLGISGLAVAFAAREGLANLFGSLIIMMEKPFRSGDWVRVGSDEGLVESVGFRSTRIRTFYDSVISIPSSKLIEATVDNLGARDYRRVKTTLALTYDTPPQKVQDFVDGIKRIVLDHPKSRKDKFHIVFNDFGEHSLDILVYFFLKVADWAEELEERERVFLQIVRLADEIGVEFAFPTETLHVETLPPRTTTPKA